MHRQTAHLCLQPVAHFAKPNQAGSHPVILASHLVFDKSHFWLTFRPRHNLMGLLALCHSKSPWVCPALAPTHPLPTLYSKGHSGPQAQQEQAIGPLPPDRCEPNPSLAAASRYL